MTAVTPMMMGMTEMPYSKPYPIHAGTGLSDSFSSSIFTCEFAVRPHPFFRHPLASLTMDESTALAWVRHGDGTPARPYW